MLPKSTQAKQHFVYREWEHISKLVANLSTKQLRFFSCFRDYAFLYPSFANVLTLFSILGTMRSSPLRLIYPMNAMPLGKGNSKKLLQIAAAATRSAAVSASVTPLTTFKKMSFSWSFRPTCFMSIEIIMSALLARTPLTCLAIVDPTQCLNF